MSTRRRCRHWLGDDCPDVIRQVPHFVPMYLDSWDEEPVCTSPVHRVHLILLCNSLYIKNNISNIYNFVNLCRNKWKKYQLDNGGSCRVRVILNIIHLHLTEISFYLVKFYLSSDLNLWITFILYVSFVIWLTYLCNNAWKKVSIVVHKHPCPNFNRFSFCSSLILCFTVITWKCKIFWSVAPVFAEAGDFSDPDAACLLCNEPWIEEKKT